MSKGTIYFYCIKCGKYFEDSKLNYFCQNCSEKINLKKYKDCKFCGGTGVTDDKKHRCIKCSMRKDNNE